MTEMTINPDSAGSPAASETDHRRAAARAAILENLSRQIRFWRQIALRSVSALLWIGPALIVSLTVNAYQYMNTPPPQVLGLDNGQLIPIQPLSEPVYSAQQVKRFVGDAILCVHVYSYLNYRSEISHCLNEYFTIEGEAAFRTENARNAAAVLKARAVSDATVEVPPQIIGMYLDNQGRHIWRVELMIKLFHGTGSKNSIQPTYEVVIVDVRRLSPLENRHGRGIVKYGSTVVDRAKDI